MLRLKGMNKWSYCRGSIGLCEIFEIERLLTVNNISFENAPCQYSTAELKQRVRQATASIREGKGFTAEELQSLHPCRITPRSA